MRIKYNKELNSPHKICTFHEICVHSVQNLKTLLSNKNGIKIVDNLPIQALSTRLIALITAAVKKSSSSTDSDFAPNVLGLGTARHVPFIDLKGKVGTPLVLYWMHVIIIALEQ